MPDRDVKQDLDARQARELIWNHDPLKESIMADDKNIQDDRDRSKVAAGEDYEVQYFAEEAGISPEQARTLIRRYGNNREKLMEEAQVMKAK